MSNSGASTIQCAACGKRYKWKPELAGRKVKCACGEVMTAPMEAPGDEDQLLEMVEPAPELTAKVKRTAPATMQATVQSPVSAAPVLGYQRRADANAAPGADAYFPDPIKDCQIPLALLIAGVVIEFVAAWATAGRTSYALAYTGATVVIGTAVLIVAMFAAAKMRGIEMGRFWTAVLKLSAISVAPSALMTLLDLFFRFILFGGLIVWVLVFCFYFAIIGVLFDLDQEDTWYFVIAVFLTKVGIFIGLVVLARSLR